MHILRLNAVPDFEARSQLGVRGMKERERERKRGKKVHAAAGTWLRKKNDGHIKRRQDHKWGTETRVMHREERCGGRQHEDDA